MSNRPKFLTDPERRPTFLEGSVLVLTRDYRGESSNLTTSFDQNELVTVISCGLVKYVSISDQKSEYRKIDDGVDWCYVEVCGMGDHPHKCCVKAEHLRTMTDQDCEDLLRDDASELTED